MRYRVLFLLFCFFEAELSLGDYVDLDDLISKALNVMAAKQNAVVKSFDSKKLKVFVPDSIEYGEAEQERSDVIDTVSQLLANPSSEATQVPFDEEYEYEDDFTWVVENGLQMKFQPKINVTEELKAFSAQTIIGRDTSDEKLADQEKSLNKTLRKNATITLPPKSSVNATWDIIEKEVHIPWTMDIEIRGNVEVKFKAKARTISIDKIAKEGEFPDDIFEVKSGYIVFHANGYLNGETAYSDILTYDNLTTESPPENGEEVTLDVEEEPTDNDLAVAEDDIALVVIENMVSSLNETGDQDSKLKSWLKVAGGIARMYSRKESDPDQWKEIADGVDAALHTENTTADGTKTALKDLRTEIHDSSQKKSKKIQSKKIQSEKKCKSPKCKQQNSRNKRNRQRKPTASKSKVSGKQRKQKNRDSKGCRRNPCKRPSMKTKNTRTRKPKNKKHPRGRKPRQTRNRNKI